ASNLIIGPSMNMSESAAHIAVSGIVSDSSILTMTYWPQATTVAVVNPPMTAPLAPPVELPNTPAVAPWKNRTIIVGTKTYATVLPSMNNQMRAPAKAPTNPSITALGA